MKNMPASWDDAKLTAVFSEYGEVSSSVLLTLVVDGKIEMKVLSCETTTGFLKMSRHTRKPKRERERERDTKPHQNTTPYILQSKSTVYLPAISNI